MSTNNAIGRFFSVKNAAIALATLLGGGAFGAYCVYRVLDQGRISIGGFAVSGLLVLAGLALFATAFPRGCRRCRRAFQSSSVGFPADCFATLEQALASGDVQALMQLRGAPLASGEVARVNLELCDGCNSLGTAQVERARWNGQYSETVQQGALHVVNGPLVGALIEITAQRAAMAPAG